jgi:acyl-CoA thioesterase
VGSSLFSRGTAVEPVAAGRYRAEMDEAWNCPLVPHGGIVTATATRAMVTEVDDPSQRLRAVHAVFAGQVRPGPVEIDVTVLRRGRSMSQLAATMCNVGADAGVTTMAVFGSSREGFSFTDLDVPSDLAPPDECPSFRDEPPEIDETRPYFNFWDHVEGRPIIGHAPWDDYEPATSLVASWKRFDDPPRDDDGTWDPLALVTLTDAMPGAVSEMVGPEARQRAWLPPSADLTVHVLEDARCEWLLSVNRARHAGDGYASADMELWDVDGPEPRLVAYGTQVMFFSFLSTRRL